MSVYSIASGVNSIEYNIYSRAPLNSPAFTGNVSGITKAMVGLGNVDHTTDALKPISNVVNDALAAKQRTFSSTTDVTVSGFDRENIYFSV